MLDEHEGYDVVLAERAAYKEAAPIVNEAINTINEAMSAYKAVMAKHRIAGAETWDNGAIDLLRQARKALEEWKGMPV